MPLAAEAEKNLMIAGEIIAEPNISDIASRRPDELSAFVARNKPIRLGSIVTVCLRPVSAPFVKVL